MLLNLNENLCVYKNKYCNTINEKFFCKINYSFIEKKSSNFDNKENKIHFTNMSYEHINKNMFNISNEYNLNVYNLIDSKIFSENKINKRWNNINEWFFLLNNNVYGKNYNYSYIILNNNLQFMQEHHSKHLIKYNSLIHNRKSFFKSNFMKVSSSLPQYSNNFLNNLKILNKNNIKKYYYKYTKISLFKNYNNNFLR